MTFKNGVTNPRQKIWRKRVEFPPSMRIHKMLHHKAPRNGHGRCLPRTGIILEIKHQRNSLRQSRLRLALHGAKSTFNDASGALGGLPNADVAAARPADSGLEAGLCHSSSRISGKRLTSTVIKSDLTGLVRSLPRSRISRGFTGRSCVKQRFELLQESTRTNPSLEVACMLQS